MIATSILTATPTLIAMTAIIVIRVTMAMTAIKDYNCHDHHNDRIAAKATMIISLIRSTGVKTAAGIINFMTALRHQRYKIYDKYIVHIEVTKVTISINFTIATIVLIIVRESNNYDRPRQLARMRQALVSKKAIGT